MQGFVIVAVNYGNTNWDAQTVRSNSNCHTGNIRYNRYHTDSYSYGAKVSVMVHEMGHVLGLSHTGSAACSGQPIMYYTSARYFTCKHIAPQADDINGVNRIFGAKL